MMAGVLNSAGCVAFLFPLMVAACAPCRLDSSREYSAAEFKRVLTSCDGVSGDVTVRLDEDLLLGEDVRVFDGNLTIVAAEGAFSAPMLVRVEGDLEFAGLRSSSQVQLPNLTSIQGDLRLSGDVGCLGGMFAYSLSVGGIVFIDGGGSSDLGMCEVSRVQSEGLYIALFEGVGVSPAFQLRHGSLLHVRDAPNLLSLDVTLVAPEELGAMVVQDCPSLTSLGAGFNPRQIRGSLVLNDVAELQLSSLSSLAYIGGDLEVWGETPSVAELSSLVVIGGDLVTHGSPLAVPQSLRLIGGGSRRVEEVVAVEDRSVVFSRSRGWWRRVERP